MEKRKIIDHYVDGTDIVLENISGGLLTDICMEIEKNGDMSWFIVDTLPNNIIMDAKEKIFIRTKGCKGTEDTAYFMIEAKYNGQTFRPEKPIKFTINHK